MKTSINWLLLLGTGVLFWACGGGSSDSSSTSSCNSTSTQGTDSAECKACVQKSCASQYSAFCSANCNANAKSSACQKASADVGACVFANCLSECDDGSGNGGAASGTAGTASGAGKSSTGSAGKSSTGGGTGGPGAVLTACYQPELHSCTVYTVPESQRELVDGQCASRNGESSDACPSANLVGCCTFGGGTAETCGYDGEDSPVSEADCMDVNGTWTLTP